MGNLVITMPDRFYLKNANMTVSKGAVIKHWGGGQGIELESEILMHVGTGV